MSEFNNIGNSDKKDHQNFEPIPNKEHLSLNKDKGEYKKPSMQYKIKYVAADRDKTKFYKEQVNVLNSISNNLKEQNEKYGKYFESKLLFKISTDPEKPLIEENFRKDLKNAGVEIISSSQSKEGVWYGYTKDASFSGLKQELKKRVTDDRPSFVDALKSISDIPVDEKIGASLYSRPFQKDETASLDVEIQILDNEDRVVVLPKFLSGFRKFVVENDGKVTDDITTEKICMFRIKAKKPLFDKIIQNKRVTLVNRAPIIEIVPREKEIEEKPDYVLKINPLPKNVHGILVMDTGIVKHPILSQALGEVLAAPTKHSSSLRTNERFDDHGHGTLVASIALYGDVQKCIENNNFTPEIKISSSKILFKDPLGTPIYDDDELIEHQLKNTIDTIQKTQPNCKVINLSIGNPEKSIFNVKKQFSLASLIDELAFKYDELIFVIAAGNIEEGLRGVKYPNHLLEDSKVTRVIDPGTSAHAITVGSLRNYVKKGINSVEYPSIFTRIGPGFGNMVKPELTEFGGDDDHDIIGASHKFATGNYFAKNTGTSMSTPKISHYFARLMNQFPSAGRNMIKALLISSAELPQSKPSPIPDLENDKSNPAWSKNLSIYGYGKPVYEHAAYSDDKRVILKHEGEITFNEVQFFPIYLPDNFFSLKGKKEISVTLVFDPPTDRDQTNYIGAEMDFKLFKNKPTNDVKEEFSIPADIEGPVQTPKILKKFEILLHPGSRVRTKGIHNKGHITYVKQTKKIDAAKPLTLAVFCRNHWIQDAAYVQNYAVIVKIKHSEIIDLYNEVRIRNQIQVRTEDIKTRARVR